MRSIRSSGDNLRTLVSPVTPVTRFFVFSRHPACYYVLHAMCRDMLASVTGTSEREHHRLSMSDVREENIDHNWEFSARWMPGRISNDLWNVRGCVTTALPTHDMKKVRSDTMNKVKWRVYGLANERIIYRISQKFYGNRIRRQILINRPYGTRDFYSIMQSINAGSLLSRATKGIHRYHYT